MEYTSILPFMSAFTGAKAVELSVSVGGEVSDEQ